MEIIVHPEVSKLKEELTNVIYSYEELVNQICPELERNYVLQFGLLEYTLYKKDVEIDKLKMKLRLIQKELNNQNPVDLDSIERILKEKFKEYEENLIKSMDELNEKISEKENLKSLSEEDALKLKNEYKKLIKALHPDLNPDQTDFEKNLFFKATDAFKSGNLSQLESISLILPNSDIDEEDEIEKLEALIEEFNEKIKKVKEDYPYNKRELLMNPKKANEYIDILNDLIEESSIQIRELKIKIDDLI